MEPHFLLTKLYTEGALRERAHRALPGAPVRPHVERRRATRLLAAAPRLLAALSWPAVRVYRAAVR